jgi:cysteine synthase A
MIVVMPDDQSSQKYDFLRRLGAGVVVVRNCGISNPEHYVNVARRICEWLQVERRYDGWYWENVVGRGNRRKKDDDTNDATQTHTCIDGEVRKKSTTSRRQAPKLLRAAFMNQFENLANIKAHYTTTGPEIYSQLQGRVDAFVMSAGTGGTLVGVGGYLKERWFRNHHHRRNDGRSRQLPPHRKDETRNRTPPPLVYLVDPPGSSLYNKIKFGVAYASQQSEQRLRRHRYDTLAEGIGLDRVTANFGLGCENISWDDHYREGSRGGGTNARPFGLRIESLMNATGRPCSSGSSDGSSSTASSKIIDDALAISDQQAVHMAHYLLRHEGLFVGSSTAMNIAGALMVASRMPEGSNVVTIVCDGGQRHTSRFWNRDFIVNEWGLRWPGDDDGGDEDINSIILDLLGIVIPDGGVPKR